MTNKKPVKVPKGTVMDMTPLRSEDPYPKYYMTSGAGKPKPLHELVYRGVIDFMSDVKTAIKAIIREVRNV